MSDPVEQIKNQLDIIEVIGEYLTLKPAGMNNSKGLCPFHGEKTPSFLVSKDKQIWHCFGCHEGGDVISFVQKLENMSFRETLELLAPRAGVVLPQKLESGHDDRDQRLKRITTAAAAYWHKVLTDTVAGTEARAYLTARGLTTETIEDWKIGYAPDRWDHLISFLKQKKCSDEDIFAAGLTVRKEKGVGYYDRFRDRIMFPLIDQQGVIVGFTGRRLTGEEGGKYVNTPQTSLYNKSRFVFGLHQAKAAIKSAKRVIVVEGQMDVISSHQAGVTNVVAASGTAFTAEQLQLLKRYTNTIAFALDADAAGMLALQRSATMAWQAGCQVEVVAIPLGKDPDDCIRQDADIWRQAVTTPQPLMAYLFDYIVARYNPSDVRQRVEASDLMVNMIMVLPNPVEQSFWLQKVSQLYGVPEGELRRMMQSRQPRAPRAGTNASATGNTWKAPAPAQATSPAPIPSDPAEALARTVLGGMIAFPSMIPAISVVTTPEVWASDDLRTLYNFVVTYYNSHNHSLSPSSFQSTFAEHIKATILASGHSSPNDVVSLVDVLVLHGQAELGNLTDREREREAVLAAALLQKQYIRGQLHILQRQMAWLEQQQRHDELQGVTQSINLLTQQLSQLP